MGARRIAVTFLPPLGDVFLPLEKQLKKQFSNLGIAVLDIFEYLYDVFSSSPTNST